MIQADRVKTFGITVVALKSAAFLAQISSA
jgi:hypothetical protein